MVVSGSVYGTALGLAQQASDDILVDLSVYQRIYVNKAARAILGLQTNYEKSAYYLDLIELDNAAQEFKEINDALLNGGRISYGPEARETEVEKITSEEIRVILDSLNHRWGYVESAAKVLVNGATGTVRSRAITQIEFQIPTLYSQIDVLTDLLQKQSEKNANSLRSTQLAFFLSAIGLLFWGYVFVRNNILSPLQKIQKAAIHISQGNLEEPIQIDQQDEFGTLAKSFEVMRLEVAKKRQRDSEWVDEMEMKVSQRTKELSALLDISTELSASLEVDTILNSVVDTALELLEGEASVICLLNSTTQNLFVASAAGPPSALKQHQAEIQPGLLTEVFKDGKNFVDGACRDCPMFAEEYLEEVVVSPLRVNQSPIGAVCVADVHDGRKNEDTGRILSFLANSAAQSIENARKLNQSQIAATLAERERMAAEMHDGLAQTLGFLNLKLDQALVSLETDENKKTKHELKLMKPAIQSAYNTVRGWLVGLSDSGLSRNNFKTQLQECIHNFEQKSGLTVKTSMDDMTLAGVFEDEQIQLIRIVQEGLANILKHADAKHVEVILEKKGKTINLKIWDDGKGFDPKGAGDEENGHSKLGLKIMRGRAERVGGALTIRSLPGEGTEITARIPYKVS